MSRPSDTGTSATAAITPTSGSGVPTGGALDPQVSAYAAINHMSYAAAFAEMTANGYSPAASGDAHSTNPWVFTGQYSGGGLTGSPAAGQTRKPSTPISQTYNDNYDWFQRQLEQNTPDAQRIVAEMKAAALISPNASFMDIMAAYEQNALLPAYNAGSHNRLMTPEDYLRNAMSRASGPAAPETWTSTSTSRTVHNPKDLAAAYQGTAQNALGRRATPAEAAAAGGAVGAAANASPSTSRTVETVNNATHQRTSNTVTHEGMGAGAIDEALLQQAMASPEYGAYQAAGHYFPLLVQALSAVNQAGHP